VIETLTGAVKVFKEGQFISDVEYTVELPSRHNNPLAGRCAKLRIVPISVLNEHFGPEKFTLLMEDGRKQDFFVFSHEGDCAAPGEPY